MANKSIYGCKTKSRPFRIPEDHYEEIVGKFNKILAKYQLKEHINNLKKTKK